MSKLISLAILIAFISGIVLNHLISFLEESKSKEIIKQKLVKFYSLSIPNSKVEILSLEEKDGMYKCVLRITSQGRENYREVYVSKNGKILTELVVLVDESINSIQKFKDFVDCLYEKGVRIYGLTNDSATLLQLNILGRYSSKLLVACDNMIQQCQQLGITRFPTIVYNNTGYIGPLNIDFFASLTNCTPPF